MKPKRSQRFSRTSLISRRSIYKVADYFSRGKFSPPPLYPIAIYSLLFGTPLHWEPPLDNFTNFENFVRPKLTDQHFLVQPLFLYPLALPPLSMFRKRMAKHQPPPSQTEAKTQKENKENKLMKNRSNSTKKEKKKMAKDRRNLRT